MSSPFPEVAAMNVVVFGVDPEKHESMKNAMCGILVGNGIALKYNSLLAHNLGEVVRIISGTVPIDIVHLFNESHVPNDVYLKGCLAIAQQMETIGERKPWVIFAHPDLQPMEMAFRSRHIYVEQVALSLAVFKRLGYSSDALARAS